MAGIPKAQDQLFDAGSSSLDKYARLVVGRAGWRALLKHEAITLVSQAVPGALGLVLRKLLYPRLLGACGRNVVFGQNVVLRHPGKIRIGDNVVIDDNCLLDAKGDGNGGIEIGSGFVDLVVVDMDVTDVSLRRRIPDLDATAAEYLVRGGVGGASALDVVVVNTDWRIRKSAATFASRS